MPPEKVRSLFFEPFGDIGSALSEALKRSGTDAKIIVMPHAASTLPVPV
jgi:nickel-dependent lactate racemase